MEFQKVACGSGLKKKEIARREKVFILFFLKNDSSLIQSLYQMNAWTRNAWLYYPWSHMLIKKLTALFYFKISHPELYKYINQ